MTRDTVTGSGNAGLRRAVERTSRRSAVSALLFLGIAVVAAGVAATLLLRYLEARRAASPVALGKVMVSSRALSLGTTLAPDMLKSVDWPASAVPPGTLDTLEKTVGRVLTSNLEPGEPILEAKLASADAGHGLAAVLPEGALAVAVRVNDVVGVAGFVHPGDRVDVIVTMKPKEDGDTPPMAKIILQNILVLAVGKQIEREEKGAAKPIQATVATLMVDSEQAERLALASAKGNLLLALRNRLHVSQEDTAGVNPQQLLLGAQPRRPTVVARAAPPPSPEQRKKEEDRVVEILRGDRFETRQFQGNPQGQ